MPTVHPRIQAASDFVSTHPRPTISGGPVRVTPGLLSLAQIGYYGRFDAEGRVRTTKIHVHIAGENGPACGSVLHPLAAFHFCASGAHTYVDCEHCQQVVERLSAVAA